MGSWLGERSRAKPIGQVDRANPIPATWSLFNKENPMRLYRHVQYWVLVAIGTAAIYHGAQFTAIAMFLLAAFQPALDRIDRQCDCGSVSGPPIRRR